MQKKIKRGQKVEVSFRPRERELVLNHTFTGPELTTRLRRAQPVDGKHVVRYTLDDLDELPLPQHTRRQEHSGKLQRECQ